MNFRTALADDAVAIAELHAASWRTAYRGMLSDAYLDGDIAMERQALWVGRLCDPVVNQHVLLAEDDDGQLLGFACAYGQHEARWGTLLENLHVRPGMKRTGVGRALLQATARWSHATYPGAALHLWVLQPNADAQAFYQALGGEAVEAAHWDTPDGRRIPQWRYAWVCLRALASSGGD
jgi:GNAT superfamily N-acetyltransferase